MHRSSLLKNKCLKELGMKNEEVIIPALRKLIGARHVFTDAKTLSEHASDAWLLSHRPDVVIFAENTQCVSQVMRFASRRRISVTVRGGGVGYVGGCVPVQGGIVLSMVRMNKIRYLNAEEGLAIVEPGVITGDLQNAARRIGMFYPPDPASLHECTIGGNIATNAGGPRCLKYGVTRHYVLGLEVVLPNGEIIQVGSRTYKNKTGFDLVGLFVGSEGLLGTVTQARLRLLPHPPARTCISVSFADERKAARMVTTIFNHGFLPSALEIADRFTLEAAKRTLEKGKNRSTLPGFLRGKAHLLIELDGHPISVRSESRQLAILLQKNGALSLELAHGDRACERLWDLRRGFSRSLKALGLRKLNEDIVVPRNRLVDLFDFTRRLQKRHQLLVASFGHAGDGNIHVNIMLDPTDPKQLAASKRVLDELFHQIIAWGGVITGEHGIGIAKKRWWPMAVSKPVRKLHEQLKSLLDPSRILNPGKFC